jgi:hypothetical protein
MRQHNPMPRTDNPRPSIAWRAARALALSGIAIALGGCAYYGAARISSVPPGAEVVNLADDTVLGVTPVSVWWQEDSDKPKFINIRLQRSGYRDKVTAFWVNLRHGSKEDALENPQEVSVEMEKEDGR